MTGKPVLAASASENVLFPAPASPVTIIRCPSAKGASLIDGSLPQVPVEGARDGEQPDVWPRRWTRQICLMVDLGGR